MGRGLWRAAAVLLAVLHVPPPASVAYQTGELSLAFKDSRFVKHMTDKNWQSFRAKFPQAVVYLYSEGRSNSETQKAPFADAAKAAGEVLGSKIDGPDIAWGAVNCNKHHVACGAGNVRGPHPQVRWFSDSATQNGTLFSGGPEVFSYWEAKHLLSWVEEQDRLAEEQKSALDLTAEHAADEGLPHDEL